MLLATLFCALFILATFMAVKRCKLCQMSKEIIASNSNVPQLATSYCPRNLTRKSKLRKHFNVQLKFEKYDFSALSVLISKHFFLIIILIHLENILGLFLLHQTKNTLLVLEFASIINKAKPIGLFCCFLYLSMAQIRKNQTFLGTLI